MVLLQYFINLWTANKNTTNNNNYKNDNYEKTVLFIIKKFFGKRLEQGLWRHALSLKPNI